MIRRSPRPGSTPNRWSGTTRPSPLRRFGPADLTRADITLAIGSAPNDIIAGAVDQLAEWTGRPPVHVDAEHEVYVTDPAVLTDVVRGARWVR